MIDDQQQLPLFESFASSLSTDAPSLPRSNTPTTYSSERQTSTTIGAKATTPTAHAATNCTRGSAGSAAPSSRAAKNTADSVPQATLPTLTALRPTADRMLTVPQTDEAGRLRAGSAAVSLGGMSASPRDRDGQGTERGAGRQADQPATEPSEPGPRDRWGAGRAWSIPPLIC